GKAAAGPRGRKPDERKSGDRPFSQRTAAKPPRFAEPRRDREERVEPRAEKQAAEQPLPTKVQTVVVTAD
ncbi:hypothetical protein, partial [Staphylococcus aureus]